MERSLDLRGLLRDAEAARVEAEIREELESHVELCAEALRAQGRTDDEARAEARARFGDLEGTLRACRRERLGGRLMLVRIQWIVIALLALTTLALALFGRAASQRAAVARDQAMAQAMQAQVLLAERERAHAPEPVEAIVVRVGDKLELFDRRRYIDFSGMSEVQKDGQALFADIGWIAVAGKSRQDVEHILTQAYLKHYDEIVVDVVVHQD